MEQVNYTYEINNSSGMLCITQRVPNELYEKFKNNEKIASHFEKLEIQEFDTDIYQVDLKDMTVSLNGSYHGNYRRQIPVIHQDFNLTCLNGRYNPKYDEIRYICYATALFYNIQPLVGYQDALKLLNNQALITALGKALNIREVHYPKIIKNGDIAEEEPKKLLITENSIGYATSNGVAKVQLDTANIVELSTTIAKQAYTYLAKKSEIKEREKQSVEAIPHIYSLIMAFYYSYLLIATRKTDYYICSYMSDTTVYDIIRVIKDGLNAPQTLILKNN